MSCLSFLLRVGILADGKCAISQHAGEVGATEPRETRTPAKRNKRMLESTKEEVEDGTGSLASQSRSRSRSRSHSLSPPLVSLHQSKVKPSVEDPNWKTSKALDKNQQVPGIMASSPPEEVDEKTSEVEDSAITEVKNSDSQFSVQQEAEDQHTARHAEGSDNEVVSADVALAVHVHVESQLESPEKSLKCRHENRGTGQGPDEGQDVLNVSPKSSKHPRDDEDEDPNPREPKRPSPPPASETKESSPKSPPPSPEVASKLVSGRLLLSLW